MRLIELSSISALDVLAVGAIRDEGLPTEIAFAESYELSRHTVRPALNMLAGLRHVAGKCRRGKHCGPASQSASLEPKWDAAAAPQTVSGSRRQQR